jgi:glycosyltransferase involved in cell wall biosynthesis
MNLIIITSKFPYDQGEEFLETEIKYLAPKFGRIIILPTKLKQDSTITRSLPKNVHVHEISNKWSNFVDKAANNLKNIKYLFYGIIQERTLGINKLRKLFFIINISANLNIHLKQIKKTFPRSNFTIYSYWFASILLGIFLKKNLGRSVTRLHRGDLYEDRNHIPFRKYLYKKIDHLCPISLDGKKHILARHNIDPGKVQVHRLGVEDLGTIIPESAQPFTILSCSFMVEVKRIHLIIDALSRFDKEVRWVHVGSGPLHTKLLKEANEKLNCHFEFLGYLPNKELIEIYRKFKPNLFINCSASEGIPVSMMEAISFGVPILATDVGGVSEIVNEETGFLMDETVTGKELYENIKLIMDNNLATKKRNSAKEFFTKHFNAENNYLEFIENILIG